MQIAQKLGTCKLCIHLRCGKGTDLIFIKKFNSTLYCNLRLQEHRKLQINKFGILNDSCIAAKMISIMSNGKTKLNFALKMSSMHTALPRSMNHFT